jgi:hypothetical protein
MNFCEKQPFIIRPKPVTQEYLNDIFVYKETPDGGMVGYFPHRIKKDTQPAKINSVWRK